MRRLRAMALALACAGVAGCGWHLAGQYNVPDRLQPVYLDAGGVSYEMREGLRQALTVSGTTLVSSTSGARSVLHVRDGEFDRRVLSVGVDGKVREHELRYTVVFDMRHLDGTVLHPEQRVELWRDTTFDEDNVLGRENEERVLRAEMEQQAVQQILRRLRAVLARAA